MREAASPAERIPLLRRLLQPCEGVAYAHDAGVVHRDIKPANIMLGEFDETLVVDWGLARRLNTQEGLLPEVSSGDAG